MLAGCIKQQQQHQFDSNSRQTKVFYKLLGRQVKALKSERKKEKLFTPLSERCFAVAIAALMK